MKKLLAEHIISSHKLNSLEGSEEFIKEALAIATGKKMLQDELLSFRKRELPEHPDVVDKNNDDRILISSEVYVVTEEERKTILTNLIDIKTNLPEFHKHLASELIRLVLDEE